MTSQAMLDAGARRVVLGSGALADEATVVEAMLRFGDRLVVGIETDEGRIRSRGAEPVDLPLAETLGWLVAAGAHAFLVTAVAARRARLGGPDAAIGEAGSSEPGRPVLAAGGISEHRRSPRGAASGRGRGGRRPGRPRGRSRPRGRHSRSAERPRRTANASGRAGASIDSRTRWASSPTSSTDAAPATSPSIRSTTGRCSPARALGLLHATSSPPSALALRRLIAEVKRASPSAGAIDDDADPTAQAVAYADAGAARDLGADRAAAFPWIARRSRRGADRCAGAACCARTSSCIPRR